MVYFHNSLSLEIGLNHIYGTGSQHVRSLGSKPTFVSCVHYIIFYILLINPDVISLLGRWQPIDQALAVDSM